MSVFPDADKVTQVLVSRQRPQTGLIDASEFPVTVSHSIYYNVNAYRRNECDEVENDPWTF
ncbi:MAG: hypothetical protein WC648_02740 [Candidatus Paceibacterota bacterium]